MTDVGTLTVADFLLARIADDEKLAARMLDNWIPGDPVRLMAECAAKRALVEREATEWIWCPEANGRAYYLPGPPRSDDSPVLRIIAAVYADHPDYRAEWTP